MKPFTLTRSAFHLSLLSLAIGLTSCDLEDPAKVEDAESQEARPGPRERERFALVSDNFAYPRDTVLEDELSHTLKDLNLIVRRDGQSASGKMTVEVEEEREITILSPNIRRIKPLEMQVKTTLQISDQPFEITEAPTPLVGRILHHDRNDLRVDGPLPSPKEAAALDAYDPAWIGDDTLFPSEPVKENETWAVTPETFLKAVFRQDYTKGRGKVELRILQFMNYDGHQCAEIYVLFDHCEGTLEMDEGTERQVELHGNGRIFRALEFFDTLKAEFTGTARITITDGPSVMEGPGYFELNAFRKVKKP